MSWIGAEETKPNTTKQATQECAVVSTCRPTSGEFLPFPNAVVKTLTRLGFILGLLTSGSVHADVLYSTLCLPTLVLVPIYRARTNTVKQTDRQTRLNALPDAGGYTAGMGNKVI